MNPLTLGTAGHIDHGKTALVRALTGVDTDRLPQEQSRGISIELGYASLTLPSGRRLSVIDVPGHERFVRTMVAGASGIDLFLMTVAADDGVMPQTREHAAVLRALGVERGVVAITKSDLQDPAGAAAETAELLPGIEAVPVSVRSGSGTVVTGTLWSGRIAAGDRMELLPAELRARVRAVQVHDQPVTEALAGQRVAVNLTGVALSNISRGDVLVPAGAELRPTYLIDAQLRFDEAEPEHGQRVQVHHGTRESAARMAWLGGDFWQLRLEQPLMPMAGDRLVVRQIAPPDTLGGGAVLDPHPRKHGPSRENLLALERLARREPAGPQPPARAQPLASERPPRATPPPLTQRQLALAEQLRSAWFEPPSDAELDRDDLAALRTAGRAVRVSRTIHYHPDALAEARRRVIATAERNGGAITLAQLRDELGTSRKFAQALLEHFDSERLTIRRENVHVLRRDHG